jgi:DNA-binding response OmpR family regulator
LIDQAHEMSVPLTASQKGGRISTTFLLKRVEGPSIYGHVVRYNDDRQELTIDGIDVEWTRTEYALLRQVLQAEGRVVPLTTLARQTLLSPLDRDTRRSLTQHVSRIRPRLELFGLTIRFIIGHGYLVIPLPEQAEAVSRASGSHKSYACVKSLDYMKSIRA